MGWQGKGNPKLQEGVLGRTWACSRLQSWGALAMTAGLITPPLLIGFLANDPSIQACEYGCCRCVGVWVEEVWARETQNCRKCPWLHLGLLTLAMTAGFITPPLLMGFLANIPSIQACESLVVKRAHCVCVCLRAEHWKAEASGSGMAGHLSSTEMVRVDVSVYDCLSVCSVDNPSHASLLRCCTCRPSSSFCLLRRQTQPCLAFAKCCADLIQAALLVCAIMTAIQVTGIGAGTRFPVQLGAGMLSVM